MHVLAEETLQPLLVPAPQDTLRPGEEAFGESPEGHQGLDCLLRSRRIERKFLAGIVDMSFFRNCRELPCRFGVSMRH